MDVKLYWQLLQLHHIMETLLGWVKYHQRQGHAPQNMKWPYLKFRLGTNVPAPNPFQRLVHYNVANIIAIMKFVNIFIL